MTPQNEILSAVIKRIRITLSNGCKLAFLVLNNSIFAQDLVPQSLEIHSHLPGAARNLPDQAIAVEVMLM
jgi:hypothetical protein